MDMSNMAKILALMAIVFVGFMLWKNMSEKKISPPMPYKALEKYMNSAEGQEYDMEEDDDMYYPEDTDAEDDMDMEDDDMYMEDDDMDMEDDHMDMEDDDMADAEDEPYDDTMDAEDSLPKVMKPAMPLLTPSSQLLPKVTPEAADFAQFAPKNLQAQNFLTATQWVGVNTQGSSLKNANYDLRANPLIPKADVGPWAQSTIEANIYQRELFG
jgi:hypothetical protein